MRDFPSWIPGGVPSLPMPCPFLSVASGGNYTATVNPVASGVFQMHVLVDGLGLRSAEQWGESGGESLVWLSFHDGADTRGLGKACQLMRIDGRDLHFIWYLWQT
jgi:hypothetical protein